MVHMERIVETVPEVRLNHVAAMASVWSVYTELCFSYRRCVVTIAPFRIVSVYGARN